MLKIFADKNITDAIELLSPFGHVVTVPGRNFTADLLKDADVLLIRSVTKVDAELLAGTRVRFVGTATAGIDHIDKKGLEASGVTVAHAPGSNAPSVADYVVTAILSLCFRERRRLADITCAVIGCGAVGGRVSKRLEALGVQVLRCDPPLHDALVAKGSDSPFTETDTALRRADVVTIHVPLHDTAPYATTDLIDEHRLGLLHEEAWLINTSRGHVVDEAALKTWLDGSPSRKAVIDVWTSEPVPDCDLVSRCAIASAHIAGYAHEGKRRATVMMGDALADWMGVRRIGTDDSSANQPIVLNPPSGVAHDELLHRLALAMYNIESDDARFRVLCQMGMDERGRIFDQLRHEYPLRHEFSRYAVDRRSIDSKLWTAVEQGLGVTLI